MKELDYYMYQFTDGTVAPYELNNKIIIAIWKVYQKINKGYDKNRTKKSNYQSSNGNVN